MSKVRPISSHSAAPATASEAKAMLRIKHLQTDPAFAPGLDLFQVLQDAYPQATSVDSDGRPETDWQLLAWSLACDFVPAFQGGKAPGRPAAPKDGLIEAVDALRASGEAQSLKHAFGILEARGTFPGVTDLRSAYYRRKKTYNL